MSTMEVIFFSAAMLIPLVGGGVVLYFLAKAAKAGQAKDDSTKE